MRLIVIGGGITGLAGAYEAARLGADVTVLEASERVGGKVWTEKVDGVPLEWGPDSFIASKPAAAQLATELGLGLTQPAPAARRAYLLRCGELHPYPEGLVMGVPRGPASAFRASRTRAVGVSAAIRALVEPLMPGGIGDGEVEATMERRLGRKWARRLVLPLVEGVYGVSAKELGMRAASPQFGGARSLLLAARRQPVPRQPVFRSIAGGMGRLVDRLLEELEDADVRLRTPAEAIGRSANGFSVATPHGTVEGDRVLVGLPAPEAARLIRGVAPDAGDALARIRFSSSAVIQLRYPPEGIARPLEGSGYLVPREEGLAHAACSWFTTKWGHPGATWLRGIVTSPEALHADDESLVRRVSEEVGGVMRAASGPDDARINRWDRALPIYAPGHLELVEVVERSLPAGLAVAGASYRGLGVPDCIDGGRTAARRLLAAG